MSNRTRNECDTAGGYSIRDQKRQVDTSQIKTLLAALDDMRSVEDQVDRMMTDVLETGGTWQVAPTGAAKPCDALVELQVHGIHALGRDVAQAISNWIATARHWQEGVRAAR